MATNISLCTVPKPVQADAYTLKVESPNLKIQASTQPRHYATLVIMS